MLFYGVTWLGLLNFSGADSHERAFFTCYYDVLFLD